MITKFAGGQRKTINNGTNEMKFLTLLNAGNLYKVSGDKPRGIFV